MCTTPYLSSAEKPQPTPAQPHRRDRAPRPSRTGPKRPLRSGSGELTQSSTQSWVTDIAPLQHYHFVTHPCCAATIPYPTARDRKQQLTCICVASSIPIVPHAALTPSNWAASSTPSSSVHPLADRMRYASTPWSCRARDQKRAKSETSGDRRACRRAVRGDGRVRGGPQRERWCHRRMLRLSFRGILVRTSVFSAPPEQSARRTGGRSFFTPL